jgi:uncharacterized protein (TIGR03435 family)
MMRSLFLATVLACGFAQAQTPAKPLAFDVVSIRPADPDARGGSLHLGAGDLAAKNMPLRNLITFAYDIRDLQLRGGPNWVATERFDVTAKPPSVEVTPDDPKSVTDEQRKASADRVRERVRTMLADRFGLVVHNETKEETVYFLTVAKSGTKMKSPASGEQEMMRGSGRGHFEATAAAMDMLANMLTGATGHPVRDNTALTGKYDWVLDFKPEGDAGRSEGADPAEADARPTVFTALQEQLGLRLEAGKGPVDLIVIDQVNQPSAN